MRTEWLLLLAALSACTDDEPAPTIADAAAGEVVEAACTGHRRKPSGCCPAGTFYIYESDTCFAAGPPECAALIAADRASECVPKWCETADKSGVCAPDDLLAGRGCDAGMWPQPDGSCAPAGLLAQRSTQWVSDLPPVAASPGIPDSPVPSVAGDQPFCAGPDTRVCATGEAGCGPGKMPSPDVPGTCITVGAPWLCPPGFEADPAQSTAPAGCRAALSDCAGDWPLELPATGVLYVRSDATLKGAGTLTAPFATLAEAVSAVVASPMTAGSPPTIALAPGAYNAVGPIARSVTIVGACAAQVSIDGGGRTAALHVLGPANVALRGVRLVGDARGVFAAPGAVVRLRRVWVEGARGVALHALGPQATLDVREVYATADALDPEFSGGGAVIEAGATGTLLDVRLSRSGYGLLALGASTTVTMRRGRIDTLAPLPGRNRMAACTQTEQGAHAEYQSVSLGSCQVYGLYAIDPGTTLAATGVLIDDLQPYAPTDGGQVTARGIKVWDGATATVSGARIGGFLGLGIEVTGTAASLTARGLVITDIDGLGATTPTGAGLAVWDHAHADIRSARITRSRRAGVAARTGCTLTLRDVLVDGRHAGANDGTTVIGLLLGGKQADLQNVRVTGVPGIGIDADGGAHIHAIELLIDGITPAPQGAPGIGLRCDHARLVLRGARISNVFAVGADIGPGSDVDALGLLIDNVRRLGPTAWRKPLAAANALQAQGPGRVLMRGSRIVRPERAGILLAGTISGAPLDAVDLIGVRVQDVLSVAGDGGGGLGIATPDGADNVTALRITATRIERAYTEGALLAGAPLTIRGSVILATRVAHDDAGLPIEEAAADGIGMTGAGPLDVRQCIIAGCARAAVVTQGPVAVTLRNNVLTGLYAPSSLPFKPAPDVADNLVYGNKNNSFSVALQLPPAPKAW